MALEDLGHSPRWAVIHNASRTDYIPTDASFPLQAVDNLTTHRGQLYNRDNSTTRPLKKAIAGKPTIIHNHSNGTTTRASCYQNYNGIHNQCPQHQLLLHTQRTAAGDLSTHSSCTKTFSPLLVEKLLQESSSRISRTLGSFWKNLPAPLKSKHA